MHAILLTDLAFTLAQHAAAQLALRHPMCQESTHGYWLACRSRHDLWSETLASHRRSSQPRNPNGPQVRWIEVMPVLREILVAEPLTRCVAHHAAVMEEATIDTDFSAIAQSTFDAHVESRQRCLQLMVFGDNMSIESSVHLNRVRRLCERLGNLLLDMMPPVQNTPPFHFSADWPPSWKSRIEASAYRALPPPAQRFTVYAGLRHQLEEELYSLQNRSNQNLSGLSTLARYNKRVAASVLRLLPPAIFDAFGLPISVRMASFQQSSDGSDAPFEPLNWQAAISWVSPAIWNPNNASDHLRNFGGGSDPKQTGRRW